MFSSSSSSMYSSSLHANQLIVVLCKQWTNTTYKNTYSFAGSSRLSHRTIPQTNYAFVHMLYVSCAWRVCRTREVTNLRVRWLFARRIATGCNDAILDRWCTPLCRCGTHWSTRTLTRAYALIWCAAACAEPALCFGNRHKNPSRTRNVREAADGKHVCEHEQWKALVQFYLVGFNLPYLCKCWWFLYSGFVLWASEKK